MSYIGKNTPPYRLPCGTANPPKFVTGSCYQHKKASEKAVPVFANVTTVDAAIPTNWMGDHAPVEPDGCTGEGTHRSPDRSYDGNCFIETPQVTVTNASISIPDHPAYYTIPNQYVDLESIVITNEDGTITYEFGTTDPDTSTDTGDWSILRPFGEGDPSTYITRQTTSRFADTDTLKISYRTGVVDMSLCHKTGWKAVRAKKVWHGTRPLDYCSCADDNGTKYLSLKSKAVFGGAGTWAQSGTASGVEFDDHGVCETTGAVEVVGSVNRATGKVSYSGCWPADGIFYGTTWNKDDPTGKKPEPPADRVTDAEKEEWWRLWLVPDKDWSPQPPDNAVVSRLGLLPSCEAEYSDPTGASWDTGSEDPDPDGRISHQYGSWTQTRSLVVGSTSARYTLVGSSLSTTHVANPIEGYDYTTVESHGSTLEITWDLSDPYTLADVGADCAAFLKTWDLSNDIQYPWRTDSACMRVPLVRSQESSNPQSPTGIPICGAPPPPEQSGDVVGAPNPAGYGLTYNAMRGHYSFLMDYVDNFCVDQGQFGEWNPDAGNAPGSGLPIAATLWTTICDERGDQYPGGAFIGVAPGDSAFVEMQKYAVTKDIAASINFFRPCGEDRANYPLAWPICGRGEIDTVEANTPAGQTTIHLKDAIAQWLQAGDEVDFVRYDGDGITEIDIVTKTVVTPVSATQFTISGSTDPDRPYVKSHGSPGYQWNDDQPKGDYTMRQWTIDICTTGAPYGFTCTDGCKKRDVCNPTVLCFSPNASPPTGSTPVGELGPIDGLPPIDYLPVDVFPNGTTYAMPNPSAQTVWQGILVPDIGDPLWIMPTGDGACDPDEFGVIPPECTQPRVESRCEPPEGAPPPNTEAGTLNLPCPPSGDCAPPAKGDCGGDWI